MSKRLQAVRYARPIKLLEAIVDDPTESKKARAQAALRLLDLYQYLDAEDFKVAAHRRKLELRKLQVENPNIPLPESEPKEKEPDTGAAFDFLKKGDKDAATVQGNS